MAFFKDSPTPATLRVLRKLHLHGIPSFLALQYLNSVDPVPNGITMQFTNIVPEFDWMFPPIFPPELSLHAATPFGIICVSTRGFIIQGTNIGTGLRVVEASGSDATYTEIFSQLIGQRSPRLPSIALDLHRTEK